MSDSVTVAAVYLSKLAPAVKIIHRLLVPISEFDQCADLAVVSFEN